MKTQTEIITKRVEYAYPTSGNADKFGYRNGCYTVQLVPGIKPSKAIAGFATIEQAKQFAETLPYPWNRLTK